MGAPFFIVFAGVNGAGKTTFFHSGLWKTADMPSRMARVNPDEIARTLKGGQSKTREEFEAGRIARQRIEQCFDEHRSFNQETTLSGHAALKNLVRARDLGYRIFMYLLEPLTIASKSWCLTTRSISPAWHCGHMARSHGGVATRA